jgi:hypothetical protein
MASPEHWLEQARVRIEMLPDGVSLAAALSRHFSEVRRLINHNRKIATMWHRTHGPKMLRRLLQSSCGTDSCARDARALLAAAGDRRYFDRWCDLLMEHGSVALQDSLQRHRATIASLLGLHVEEPTLSPPAAAEVAAL